MSPITVLPIFMKAAKSNFMEGKIEEQKERLHCERGEFDVWVFDYLSRDTTKRGF